jgi:hypothetical protein
MMSTGFTKRAATVRPQTYISTAIQSSLPTHPFMATLKGLVAPAELPPPDVRPHITE